MITFDKNNNMKGIKKGDFLLIENVLRCKVLVSYESDEVYEEIEYSWSEIAIPMNLISYFSLHVNSKGMVVRNQLIVTLDDGKEIVIKGDMDHLTQIYNTFVNKDRVYKFN